MAYKLGSRRHCWVSLMEATDTPGSTKPCCRLSASVVPRPSACRPATCHAASLTPAHSSPAVRCCHPYLPNTTTGDMQCAAHAKTGSLQTCWVAVQQTLTCSNAKLAMAMPATAGAASSCSSRYSAPSAAKGSSTCSKTMACSQRPTGAVAGTGTPGPPTPLPARSPAAAQLSRTVGGPPTKLLVPLAAVLVAPAAAAGIKPLEEDWPVI